MDIKNYMTELNVDIDNFQFSDLMYEDNDILTEEKFKAILKQKGMDSTDEENESKSMKPTDKSELIFINNEQLQEFISDNDK